MSPSPSTESSLTQSLWKQIQQETHAIAEAEPVLASFLQVTILKHDTLLTALSFLLAEKLERLRRLVLAAMTRIA